MTYFSDGGDVDPKSKVVYYGEPYGELPEPVGNDGGFFRGWYTDRWGRGTEITSESIVDLTSNITLYALWIYPVNPEWRTDNTIEYGDGSKAFFGFQSDSDYTDYWYEWYKCDKDGNNGVLVYDYQPVFLDAEELQHLFEVVKGTKLELPVLVAAFYGLRRGEVCGLKWDAIDFERGTITIRHTVTSLQVDGKTKMYAQDSAKTKSSMRTLPLVGSFAEYFKEVKAAQEVNKKVCGNCYNYEYDGYVFVDELGDLMRPEYLTSYFPQYIQKHGCKRMRFHDLRHSCASLLLANGVPLKQIQEWLGHSDFSTTANIYAHLDYTSKLSSAKAMVSGMTLPESVNFSSKWTEISNDGGKN